MAFQPYTPETVITCSMCRYGAHDICLARIGLACSCGCTGDTTHAHTHYVVECPACEWDGEVCQPDMTLLVDILLDEWALAFPCGGCGRDVELRIPEPVVGVVWQAGARVALQ